MRVVISQPMLFPWAGMLEQVLLADVYVNYHDVQYSKGSFSNRVQIKTSKGMRWMTVPLQDLHLGQRIDQVLVDDRKDWRSRHIALVGDALAGAPYSKDAMALVEGVYGEPCTRLGALGHASLLASCRYLGVDSATRFLDVSSLDVPGSGSQRVLDIVRSLGGGTYITGHGALNYLDHEAFEAAGIRVEYMVYGKVPYPQLHGNFTPFVSCLDLIANRGPGGADCLNPSTVYWKELVDHE